MQGQEKENNFSIPNMMSAFRILLIPVFVLAYFLRPDAVWISVMTLAISGLTDVVDGIIARKFHMITQLGKVLDPVADKLTQATVCVCLTISHPQLLILLVVLGIKELTMMCGGIYVLKTGHKPISAKWFGKLCTCVLFGVFMLFLLFPNMGAGQMYGLIGVGVVFAAFSLIMYISEFFKIKKS